jgi:O-antigen ligase
LAVLVLAIIAGSSHARSVELIAKGFATVALAVTVYALGVKLLPGLHVPGVFDFNQMAPLPRLQEPFGYSNALAVFIAMGVPIALALAIDRSLPRSVRLGALVSVELMFLAIGLTYSRGGMIALAVGLAVAIGLSRARLRMLMWLALVAIASVPPLVFGLTADTLTNVAAGLSDRERGGAELLVVLLVSLAALWLAALRLMALERTVRVGSQRADRIGRALVGAAAAVVVIALVAVAASSRGLDGTVSHAWNSFTATRAASVDNPSRLLSADSENRWVWWKEAAGAFTDRPITGWGAGSFRVVHLLYRHNQLPVNDPHSVPLQLLAETGLIGALLALGAYGLLLAAAIGTVRLRAGGPERWLAAALVAIGVMSGVHALYDWDWDIPGVMLPAIVALGVLAGARRRPSRGPTVADQRHRALAGPGPAVRAVALAAVTLTLCLFAISGVLPSIAATKATSALVTASSSSPGALQRAQSAAQLATSLDPLSDAGLRVQSTIAVHRGDFKQARSYLYEALGRNPSDVQAWAQLAFVDIFLQDARAAVTAARRVLELDPMGMYGRSLLDETELLVVPPSRSATAVPLSPG